LKWLELVNRSANVFINEETSNVRSALQLLWFSSGFSRHLPYVFALFALSDITLLLCFGLDKENLCLYGHPSETWEVALPAEEVPPELPEPALGINFARDGMNRKDWLSLVAVHSDSWLLSVAFYLGARLNRNER
jgi:hypothetical protein